MANEPSKRPPEPPSADAEAERRRTAVASAMESGWLERELLSRVQFGEDRYEFRRLFAEVLGTFLLVFVAAGGAVVNARFGGSAIPESAQAVAPGLMVASIILFMGAVSGAHLNPVVSIAFALRRDFPWKRVPLYLVAQLAGALLAMLVLVLLLGEQGAAGLTQPGSGIGAGVALAWEALLTLGLVSVILGTASGAQNVGWGAAIGVGAFIALAGLIGAPVSGASMNPARSLGPAIVLGDYANWWIYVVGPALGSLVAVGFAYLLRGPGGGPMGRRAGSGTLGTDWVPGQHVVPSDSVVPVPPESANGGDAGDDSESDSRSTGSPEVSRR